MSHSLNKLRAKAYFAYDNLLDKAIDKSIEIIISNTAKFLTSHFTIELNYDLEDINILDIVKVLKIIERHFHNKKASCNTYSTYYGEYYLKTGTFYTEYFPQFKSFMTIYYFPTNESDTVSFYFWGKKPKELCKFFVDLFTKATYKKTTAPEHLKIITHSLISRDSGSPYFGMGNSTDVKKWDNIFIEEDISNTLLTYLDSFKKAESLFNKIEVTYKLGILLYGPPGTGKTSIAKTIAKYIGNHIYIVNMAYFSPAVVNTIKETCAANNCLTVFLLEDIDYIFGKRQNDRTKEEKANGNVLLQLLDGADSSSKAVFIATTNDIDSLDPAITRDGRFDLKIHMDNISTPLAETMVKSIGIESDAAIHEILDYSQEKHNPAQVQNKTVQYIFNHIEDLNSLVNADHLIDDLEEDEDED